jgi:CRP/FNR family transcriptional regulator, cAMP and macrophage regulator
MVRANSQAVRFTAVDGGRGHTVERQAEWIAQSLGRPELAPLGPEDIRELAALLREERYPAGTTVFCMGEAPTRILIVRRGAIELSRILNGRRVVLQIMRPGGVMGDVGLFLRKTAPYDGVALEDTVILSLDSVRFHRLLEQRPQLAWRWLISVSGRLESYQSRLMELLAGGLEAQIASVLVRRAEHGVVNLSQSSLAELVGGRRTSVNRVLKRLEEQDLVRVRYGQVEILDEPGLAKAAGLD